MLSVRRRIVIVCVRAVITEDQVGKLDEMGFDELAAKERELERLQRLMVSRRLLDTFYPEDGRLSRHAYPKHMAFFAAGVEYRERMCCAANRVGKTLGIGGYETTLHLTGLYPSWWVGRRFGKPVKAWVAGKTNETTRDIVQTKLFGNVLQGARKSVDGTGLIPHDCIGEMAWKQGVTDLLDHVKVRHASGGLSMVGIKAYQQGRGSFEGTEQDVVWLDEEPPMDIYGECLIRTMTTDGMIMLTFTPLEGWSEVVMSYFEACGMGRGPGPAVATVGISEHSDQ
jgi:phage terminase large subunit-like protein